MPWGWECRQKLIKQLPPKPTEKRRTLTSITPGPSSYEHPEILGGKGFSHIRRAPAYTFGRIPKDNKVKLYPKGPLINVSGFNKVGGRQRLTHGLMTPRIPPYKDKSKKPGPSDYEPKIDIALRHPPAYSILMPAKPPYQPWDQWTPSPNMYNPAGVRKGNPAFTIGYPYRPPKDPGIPVVGEYDPKFDVNVKKMPEFSFGAPFRPLKPSTDVPAPNTYCHKKLMYTKKSAPLPSFGIKHSPYMGRFEVQLMKTECSQ